MDLGRLAKRQPAGGLTKRWSGRVEHKVPSSYIGVCAAQLDR